MIFDCHAHLYSPSVIGSVSRRDGLAAALGLNMEGALNRTDKPALKQEFTDAGIQACLLLPIAPANGVHTVNELFVKTVEGEDRLFTAGTLHPSSPGMSAELEWLGNQGVRAIKLCSFSQGFDLEAGETLQLFEKIRRHNRAGKTRFFVVLDTFYAADVYFGSPRQYITTPVKLARLTAAFPEIDFVGAHMGGLTAPFPEIEEYLVPANNLYLDTSNASKSLSREEFLRMIFRHGPDRLMFGTDWPWFSHAKEAAFIGELLRDAGLSPEEQSKVFSGNICRLMDLNPKSIGRSKLADCE
jgi:predicted TIM-barrel fold metal-dependent hydrolase